MADQPELDDIQGVILRGLGMPFVRHLVFTVSNSTNACAFLGSLISGEVAGLPQIIPATPWTTKPSNGLALGITSDGLTALGVDQDSMKSFPLAFRQGAVKRASIVGDVDANAPDNWDYGFNSDNVHIILSVYAITEDERESACTTLIDAFSDAGTLLSQIDGHVFPEGYVHFGYHDGISNPNIAGMTAQPLADDQPEAPPGEFFLGYPNQFTGQSYPVPSPAQLGKNGSYNAFRVLGQDVAGFEALLQEQADATGQPLEWIAAKIVGRWRNGNPLELTPDTSKPNPPIPADMINKYDYIETDTNPDDTKGTRCPIGAHMRRANPRSEKIAGGNGAGNQRRIMRRATPYGPIYKPGTTETNPPPRGLIGPFFVGDIASQFEFVMQQWVNASTFTANLPAGSGDPLLSNNENNTFSIAMPNSDPIVINNVPQFIFTKGGAYCFTPSFTAIRYLASLPTA